MNDSFFVIRDFVNELASCFGDTNRVLARPLSLYKRLLARDDTPKLQHIEIFRRFSIQNRVGLFERNFSKFENKKIVFSNRIFIDLEMIFRSADPEITRAVWKYMLTLSVLLDSHSQIQVGEDNMGMMLNSIQTRSDPKEILREELRAEFPELYAIVETEFQLAEKDGGKDAMGVFNALFKNSRAGTIMNAVHEQFQSGELTQEKIMALVMKVMPMIMGEMGRSGVNPMMMSMLGGMMGGGGGNGGGGGGSDETAALLQTMMAGLASGMNDNDD